VLSHVTLISSKNHPRPTDVSSGTNRTLVRFKSPNLALLAIRNGNDDALENPGEVPTSYSSATGYVNPSFPTNVTSTRPLVPAPLCLPVVTSTRYFPVVFSRSPGTVTTLAIRGVRDDTYSS
jgi:hypothetical protein